MKLMSRLDLIMVVTLVILAIMFVFSFNSCLNKIKERGLESMVEEVWKGNQTEKEKEHD